MNLLVRVILTELKEAAEQGCRLHLAPDFVREQRQELTSQNCLLDTK